MTEARAYMLAWECVQGLDMPWVQRLTLVDRIAAAVQDAARESTREAEK